MAVKADLRTEDENMEDNYGRNIDYMRISITDRCNLRCKYCMPDGITLVPMECILTYEEILLVCQAAVKAGISKFKITGGEPLVRPGCAEFIGMLTSLPGVRQVTMTTNGVLLSENLPQLMRNGLHAVNISLDTLNPSIYRQITGKNELSLVLDGIHHALEAGMTVKLNSVLQKGCNDKEWMKLAELTEKYPVDVRFIEMMPIGHGREYETVYNEEVLDWLRAYNPGIHEDDAVHGNGPAVYYKFPDAKGSIGFISAMHGKFCNNCNRLRLTSVGELKPCLCFRESVDLWGILKEPDKREREQNLYEAVLKAVCMKPESHRFETAGGVTEEKQMAQIGG